MQPDAGIELFNSSDLKKIDGAAARTPPHGTSADLFPLTANQSFPVVVHFSFSQLTSN